MRTDNTNTEMTKLEFARPLANYNLQDETNTFAICNESQVLHKIKGIEEQKQKQHSHSI
jgi:hypothetical protein